MPLHSVYAAVGSATLKTLTKGALPLSGRVAGESYVATGDVDFGLALNPTSGNLVALGFLPVKASVVIPLTSLTGNVGAATGLTASAKVRIKLPSVTLFGLQLAGGSNCQTKNPSVINFKSPGFNPLDGGTLTGTFAISDLTGCGGLTGLVSPLTAGGGNAIALKLTPTS